MREQILSYREFHDGEKFFLGNKKRIDSVFREYNHQGAVTKVILIYVLVITEEYLDLHKQVLTLLLLHCYNLLAQYFPNGFYQQLVSYIQK